MNLEPTPSPADVPGDGNARLREAQDQDATRSVAPPEAADKDATQSVAPRRADRWAHRRVEPRFFAFLWTTFLFAATAVTLISVGFAGVVTPAEYRPAARALFLLVAIGITAAWPLIRLSQTAPDRGPGVSAAQDFTVVLVTQQPIIWPQAVLAHWPIGVVAAVAATLAGWSLLVAVLLARAQRSLFFGTGASEPTRSASGPASFVGASSSTAGAAPSDLGRSSRRVNWMAGFLALAVAGPIAAALATPGRVGAPVPDFRWPWMLSPTSAVYEITADRFWSGRVAGVTGGHWTWAAGIAGAALLIAAMPRRALRPSAGSA